MNGRGRERRRQWLGLVVCALSIGVAGCGASHPATARRPPAPLPRVLFDGAGRGTFATATFNVPRTRLPWGIAYAFTCGSHAAEFDIVLYDTEIGAELPYAGIYRHGTAGRGLRMETGNTGNVYAPNGIPAGIVEDLHIKTACRWHVRVVDGPEAFVWEKTPRV